MFDNLRQKSTQDAGFTPSEDISPTERALGQPKRATSKARASSGGGGGGAGFLGLTPFQRFVLTLELFLIVSLLGCGLLVALERIALPF